jgi:hypothetical protein
MNCAPGCAAPDGCCGSGWPSTPVPSFCPCFSSAPARNTRRIGLSTHCESSWPPFGVPLFSSDGLNLSFSALTAHFGPWLQVVRRGRTVSEWQVAAELIYGQVKKCYRRRKLVRVTHVMRLGTQDADPRRLTGIRLLWTVEHGLYRAGESDRPPWLGRSGSPNLGHSAAISPSLGPSGVVASVLSRMSRPHASLRVTLEQPRERGGKRLAQHYRQRTRAMAAGRTNRRWTAREVLSCPLTPASA